MRSSRNGVEASSCPRSTIRKTLPMAISVDIRTRNVASLFLLFLAVFLLYSQTVTFDWSHFDDEPYVLQNPMIGLPPVKALTTIFSVGYFGSYTPLTLISHAIDLSIWGPSPAGHHLTNVLLHSLNAVWVMVLALVFLRGRGLAADPRAGLIRSASGRELWSALLAAGLFAFHPLRAESVAWISDRKDLLAAAFALPATALYLHARWSGRARVFSLPMVLSLLLFAAGALSKTAAVALAGVLLLLEITVIEGGMEWKKRLRGSLYAVPFLVVGAAVGFLAVKAAPGAVMGYGVGGLSDIERLLLPGYSLSFYLWKTIVPFPLVPVYVAPPPGLIVAALIGVLLLGAVLAIALVRGRRAIPIALSAYVILILPTIAGVAAAIQPWADRYSYLSTVPLFLVIGFVVHGAAGGFRVWRWRLSGRSVSVFAVVLVALSGVLSVVQSRIWYNARSLWSHQLAYGERHSIALNGMGYAYLQEMEYRKARDCFDEAVRLDPDNTQALLNLYIVAHDRADSLQIIEQYRTVLLRRPWDAHFHHVLGRMYRGQGMEDSAVVEFRSALRIDPNLGDAISDLGIWHLQHGRRDSARAYFSTAIERAPGCSQPYYSLGIMAINDRDTSNGVRLLTVAARLGHLPAKQALRILNQAW